MDSGQPAHRVPTRLSNFDYASAGAYFITICAHERRLLFGEIFGDVLVPSKIGSIVNDCWAAIPRHFPDVDLDTFVLMPNHLHGILVIRSAPVGVQHAGPSERRVRHAGPLQPQRWSPPGSIGAIVRSFKSAVTKTCNERQLTNGTPIWQRNYYEHVIRKDEDMNRVRQYIIDNPKNWATDKENPNS
jgi:putative transposase